MGIVQPSATQQRGCTSVLRRLCAPADEFRSALLVMLSLCEVRRVCRWTSVCEWQPAYFVPVATARSVHIAAKGGLAGLLNFAFISSNSDARRLRRFRISSFSGR